MGIKWAVNHHKISFKIKISKKTAAKPKIIYIMKPLKRMIALSSKMKPNISESRILPMKANKTSS